MASTSNQGVELVDDDIMMEVETSDELDIDESDYTSKSDIMIVSPIVEFAGEVGPSEPYIGLEFNSLEDGREYYAAYARRNGFTIRVNRKRRSRIDRAVIGYDYVCSKEGFRPKKCLGEDKTIHLSKQSRVGCRAILVISYRREIEKWVVTNFLKEHNHELLGPSEVLVRRSLDDASNEDAKDKRIRELTAELYSERQRFQRKCSVYEERCASYKLNMSKILKDIELHSEHLTKRVEEVIRTIEELEDDEEAELHYEHLTNRVEGVVQPTQEIEYDEDMELHYEHLTNRVEGVQPIQEIEDDEDIQLHYEHLTNRVEGVVQPIQEIEDDEDFQLHYEHLTNRVEGVVQPIQQIDDDEDIELHSEHLTKKVEGVVQTIQEIEDDEDFQLHYEHLTNRVEGVVQPIQEIDDDEDIELHSEHLTKRVEGVVQTIQEIEDDEDFQLHYEHLTNRVEGVVQPIQEIEDDEDIELHSEHLTKRVEGVVQTIKEIHDDEEEKELHSEHLTKRIEGVVQTIKEIEDDDEYLMGIELSDLGSLDC